MITWTTRYPFKVGDVAGGGLLIIKVKKLAGGLYQVQAKPVDKPATILENPHRPVHASIPVGRKIRVNWVKQNRDGTVTVSVPARAIKRNSTNHPGRHDRSSAVTEGLKVDKKAMAKWPCGHYHRTLSAFLSCPVAIKKGLA